jgi:hypothetical protein
MLTIRKVRGSSMSALENFPRITPFLWFDSNAEEAVDLAELERAAQS